jgi:hypothetical protein
LNIGLTQGKCAEDLQAELIMPYSPLAPSPEPSSPPPFEELPDDEVADLATAAHMRAETSKRIDARARGIAYVARKLDDLSEKEKRVLAQNEWSAMNVR